MTQSDDSLTDVLHEAIDVLTKYSVPLYVNDARGRPDQFGTGFFVRVGASHYLVSAGHVLDRVRTQKVFFYASPDKLRSLNGRMITTANPDVRESDILDVGVMKLTGDWMPPYPEVDKFPMDISYLSPSLLPRSGKHYVIIGYPATKSGVNPRDRTASAAPYAYRSDSSHEDEYRAHGISPDTHVLLPLDLRKGKDLHGRLRTFPQPHGMSGSPVIVLYDIAESANVSRVFQVVAVGTEYREREKVLIGTDIQFVLEAVERIEANQPS